MNLSYAMIRHNMKKAATGLDGRKFYSDALKKEIMLFRKKNGYTVQECSEVLGISEASLSAMEFNYRNKQSKIQRMEIKVGIDKMSNKQLERLLKKIKDQM